MQLAAALAETGPVGVTEAAELLGVAPSTAHRLLAMLVHRDFAEQGHDRRYRAGPMLRGSEERPSAMKRLQQAALPHLRDAAAETGETVSLQILVAGDVCFVESIEGDQLLRVGSRKGMRLPAHQVSGGLVLLAALDPDDVQRRCRGLTVPEMDRLDRELAAVRQQAFAVNDQRTEPGVSAVAVPIPGTRGRALAALALAMPSVRFEGRAIGATVDVLRSGADRIAAQLVEPR